MKYKSILTCLILCTSFTQIKTKSFSNSSSKTRILPLLQKVGESLDEVRWSIGDVILSPTTITNPGVFILGDNFEGSIHIDSDHVYLDLNNYQICDTTSNTTPITIKSGHTNVIIKNGSLKGSGTNSTVAGLLIEQGVSAVKIYNLNIFDFNTGIHAERSPENKIKACEFIHCLLESNNKGVLLEYAIKCIFDHCNTYNCIESGFELNNSNLNVFDKCKALKTENNDSNKNASGFYSAKGVANTFYECVANGTKKTNSAFGYQSAGFWLSEQECATKIVKCIANCTECDGDGCAFGILIDSVLTLSCTGAECPDATEPLDHDNFSSSPELAVDWSNNEQFIAIGGEDTRLRILLFENAELTEVNTIQPNGQKIRDIKWSPNGQYLALVTEKDVDDTGAEIFIYEFNPATYALTLITEEDIVDTAYCITWSLDGVYIAVGQKESPQIIVWEFNNPNLTQIATNSTGKEVLDIDFSPDGKYLAAVYEKTLEIFSFSPAAITPLVSIDSIDDGSGTYGGVLYGLDWNPVASNSDYYLAVCGTVNNELSIQVFHFDESTITSVETSFHGKNPPADPDAQLTNDIKWAPNGQYLVVGGDDLVAPCENEATIFSFDASALVGSRLIVVCRLRNPYDDDDDEIQALDWSDSGAYIVVTGKGNNETAVYQVSEAIAKKCILEENEVTGSCSIGISGSSTNNLIIKNIAYENFINYSSGIFNTYTGGLNGRPRLLDNISVPPYED